MDLPAEFVTLYTGLDRQGPGEPQDVTWAVARLGLHGGLRVCDAGCGSGADLQTLAMALPDAWLEGVDAMPHLVAEARDRLGSRADVRVGDMGALEGPFDLIWCAGALYFLGVTEGLRAWRRALAPGGVVAFSHPVLLSDDEPEAVAAFWQEYPAITRREGVEAQVALADFEVVDRRHVIGLPWGRYYDGLARRIEALRPGADAVMAAVLEAAEREISLWRKAPDRIAYLLVLARAA